MPVDELLNQNLCQYMVQLGKALYRHLKLLHFYNKCKKDLDISQNISYN